jgi:hypothetical protein
MQKGAMIEANIVNAEETLACHGGQKISFSEGRGIKFATQGTIPIKFASSEVEFINIHYLRKISMFLPNAIQRHVFLPLL